ncbi:MAG TPA: hypothetical protein VN804_00785 [Solirubrobacteraceae bacterium]|nr:hypothetical protein [Solirubrobacteraceae bacterium]
MSRALLAALAAAIAFVLGVAPAAAVNVQIVNSSGLPASSIYLLLEKGSSSDGQLQEDTPKLLSEINDSTFSLGAISGARLYFSYGAPVKDNEPPAAPTRYDKIELTNPGVADLTAVDFFAIPFNMQSLDSSGATVGDAVGYRCYTSTIVQKLREVGPAAEVTDGGQFVRFLSPQLAAEGSYPSLAPYIDSMAGQTIEVNDTFAKEGEEAKQLSYKGTFEADGTITLTGTITTGGTPAAGLPLHIEGATLPQGVYSGDGAFTVNGQPADVSQNNEYSVIYRDIVAGFGLGYWGGKYGDDSANWLHKPNFAAARLSSSPFPVYSLYASTIAEYSSAYGYSFSELGPDEVTVPLEASVATLRVTIDPDQGPSTPGCVGESTPAAGSTGSGSGSGSGSSPASSSHPGGAAGSGAGQVKVAIDTAAAKLEKRGRVLLTLSCSGDPCKGELALTHTALPAVKRPRRGHARVARAQLHAPSKARRTTVLGRTVFSIEQGKRQSVWVDISPAARRLIQSARSRRLSVLAEALVGPPRAPTVAARRAITLAAYTPPRHARRPHR